MLLSLPKTGGDRSVVMSKKLPRFEIGTKFGDWTVIAQADKSLTNGDVVASSLVRCVCGKERECANGYLRTGRSNGCGCKRAEKFANGSRKHGKSHSSLYGLWASIKHRLTWDRSYEGVRMYEPWVTSFVAFESFIVEVLGPKPTPEHSLDRIKPGGHYEPGNLRWATKKEQSANRGPFKKSRRSGGDDVLHGKTNTPLYHIWIGIKERLQRDRNYDGIKLHEPWVNNFVAFEAHILSLGPKPTPQHTLDRIEPTGDYAPGNLRWADKTLQSENRRNSIPKNVAEQSMVSVGQKYDMLTVLAVLTESRYGQNQYLARVQCDCGTIKTIYQKQLLSGRTKSCGCFKNQNLKLGHLALEKPIEANGETMSLSAWATKLGVSKQVIWNRVNKLGWDLARAVTEPMFVSDLIEINGEKLTAREWSKLFGVPASVITRRVSKGWEPARAVATPTREWRARPNTQEKQPDLLTN